jgi:hypothetical protein
MPFVGHEVSPITGAGSRPGEQKPETASDIGQAAGGEAKEANSAIGRKRYFGSVVERPFLS